MKKRLLSILLIGGLVVTLTGCGDANKQKEYSDSIKETRKSTVLLLGEHNVGEYLDYVLTDYEWSENDSYRGTYGNGAVIVKGKDRKTGNDIEILWVKELTSSTVLSPVEYIKCNGEDMEYMTCDGTEYSYNKFLSYLSDYKNEVEEHYSDKNTEE